MSQPVQVGGERWQGARFVMECLISKWSRQDVLDDPELGPKIAAKSEEWRAGFNTAFDNAEREGYSKPREVEDGSPTSLRDD